MGIGYHIYINLLRGRKEIISLTSSYPN